ncbi:MULTISPECIES: TIGR04283 family arsenosugar biosynthesis glycosyltransferase [Cyanophyceae]|uniref:TIGR04283 family arsenosugar biosynthesis glycosyltransferase n=1 Tax=Cyanophyceae TaxID=3028117 RepID=UPI001686E03B|nr:TIGR04283 family arsenosugar biosynthesis glycosyltransferase [Trichocoleus sp. FACHB-69]MBD1932886.1 TIGR04283 family arsenosugar biosynthesis glycosyltransferase [Trichocoleus sp. FACHB-69]
MTEAPRISVIIPVLNEASRIRLNLASFEKTTNVEVIVVDGGSQDETVAIAKSLGVQVLSTAAGRDRQMNVGAKVATGDILLFLHADSRLPFGFDAMVRQALAERGTIAGAFELKIDARMRSLRLVEKMVNWRSRFLHLPYGDQAIFLKASVFHEIGGFPNLPIMEDFEFILRLRRLGNVTLVPASVLTSARRWQKLGVLKTTLINQIVIIGYFLGFSPSRLAEFYRTRK